MLCKLGLHVAVVLAVVAVILWNVRSLNAFRWAEETLGIPCGSAADAVERAYRAQAKVCHPDALKSTDSKQFLLLGEARRVMLEDPDCVMQRYVNSICIVSVGVCCTFVGHLAYVLFKLRRCWSRLTGPMDPVTPAPALDADVTAFFDAIGLVEDDVDVHIDDHFPNPPATVNNAPVQDGAPAVAPLPFFPPAQPVAVPAWPYPLDLSPVPVIPPSPRKRVAINPVATVIPDGNKENENADGAMQHFEENIEPLDENVRMPAARQRKAAAVPLVDPRQPCHRKAKEQARLKLKQCQTGNKRTAAGR
ncbi:uncharacterized protein LOC129596732 [Paramacrobiotus metropolitanus]|uniref:uncharacterized protein LOC129596732 n=1 Tax=Paramacrobiotus metropolitanus TaxID=2943436 RepID=UPI0024456B02|nr:uncharacterized protein LOC129596732 [Paramacrobiotus metropolitanus]